MVEGLVFIIRLKEVVGWFPSFKDSEVQVSQHEPYVSRQDLKKTCMERESVDTIEGEEVDALSLESFDLIAKDYKKINKTHVQQTKLVLDSSCHDTVHVSPPLDADHVSPLV
ncbi:hypothetical protein L2E82_14497 [Cichorium intybus]|uniref:Uncharacterized protein n=1 Tax=Cichorium intybus TaxID=13427 RepID=A0ACB9F0S2_CICIN|nr:hypothetical protein L2E82_14497 [Cichorium intybus]